MPDSLYQSAKDFGFPAAVVAWMLWRDYRQTREMLAILHEIRAYLRVLASGHVQRTIDGAGR